MKSFVEIILILMITIISCHRNSTGIDKLYPEYKVAFISFGSIGNASLNMCDLSGLNHKTLFDSIHNTFELDWSPDANYLIYTQPLDSRGLVYIVDKDGLNSRLLFDMVNPIY